MLLDSSHRPWIVVTVVLFLALLATYVPYHLEWSVNGPRGSTWPGLAYGVAGSVLMLYAGAIGVRRKVRAWQLGRATTWLRGHIWLGLLSYPLIFFHAGFRLGGTLTVVLLVLFTIVVITGIHGLAVQHIVPRLMTVQVLNETMYEQIPTYVKRLGDEAVRAVSEVCGPVGEVVETDNKAKAKEPIEGHEPLKQFYLNEVKAYLADGRGRLGAVASRSATFSHLKMLVPPSLHATLATLEELCEERRQLSVQVRLHHWLHGWLIVHLPAAAALIVLSVVHAVASLYY